MRSLILALLLAAVLIVLVALQQLPLSPFVSAPIAVGLGVAAASFAQGKASWLTVIAGALSLLTYRWLAEAAGWLGFASMGLLWLLPRLTLTRSRKDLLLALGFAVASSLVAGLIITRYAPDQLARHLASCLFAGTALALATILPRTNTPFAQALEDAAQQIHSPSREKLLQAAELHRQQHQLGASKTSNPIAWNRLLKIADQRAGFETLTGESAERTRIELDKQIESLLEPLHLPAVPAPAATPAQKPPNAQLSESAEASAANKA